MKKVLVFSFLALSIILTACGGSGNSSAGGPNNPGTDPGDDGTKSASLDFIFNNQTLGETTITVSVAEWNTLLSYYDQNPHNESSVHAAYTYVKDGKTWNKTDIGLKIRGNSSRVRPENGTHGGGSYNQAHFGIDFEQWLADGVDNKIEDCMKGVILKFFNNDPAYVREIYCYDFFRRNGIWTAPRSAYTKLTIKIGSDTVYYGIYEMVEQPNKTFLSSRTTKEAGTLAGNDGFLWKCCCGHGSQGYADFAKADLSYMGCEDVSLDESKSKYYTYDLKTQKSSIGVARTQLSTFITALNALNTSDTAATKAWFESKMDVNLFLKTYAVNVILGMWDDYWANGNNYYSLFDEDGKFYFIPFDYDNTLGTSCSGFTGNDAATCNPLEWGDGKNSPLMDKMLTVPEFKKIYSDYLVSLSNSASDFDSAKSIARIQTWHSLIKNYVKNDTTVNQSIYDEPAYWGCTSKYRLLSGDASVNYFKAKAAAIAAACGSTL